MESETSKRKIFTGLVSQTYEHPFDRQALISLEKMPGVSLLFKKVNEYGIDRLLGFKFNAICMKVNERNFPNFYQAFVEACNIIDVSPIPELYLIHGTGYIKALTIGTNKPMVIINIDGLEALNYQELLYVFGHELGHIKLHLQKGNYIADDMSLRGSQQDDQIEREADEFAERALKKLTELEADD